MSFKINLQEKIKASFEGPSKSYFDTKNRFEQIMTQKLGKPIANYNATMLNTLNVQTSFNDLTRPSGATAEKIDEKLKGTALEGLGEAFVKAEKEHGVNAWFLTAVAKHESGNGTSRIATEKNNLFGFQAYDASPYVSSKMFESQEAGIDYVASFLKKAYLTPGGAYYNGTSVDAVGFKYATDKGWAEAIKRHMTDLNA